MLLVLLYLLPQSGSFANILSIIALYAFADYRLMPALQKIYEATTQLSSAGQAVDALHADLMNLQPAHPNPSQEVIALNQAIIRNIQFQCLQHKSIAYKINA